MEIAIDFNLWLVSSVESAYYINIKLLLLFVAFFGLNVYAQIIPFAFWNNQDPCSRTNPAIGAECINGTIYAGVYNTFRYFITPGNCTDSSTPTCNGTTDTLQKKWRGSGGSDVDTSVENLGDSNPATQDGISNTATITAHSSTNSDSAADYCQDMVYGGKSDWYLPTKSEMAYIYTVKTPTQGI